MLAMVWPTVALRRALGQRQGLFARVSLMLVILVQDYPRMLVTAGLHDPRVAYWEPAKYVAKLRLNKTDNNMLLFKCDLGAGHFSQSGRFDALKELAIDYAFVIWCAGKLDAQPHREREAASQ